MDGVAAHMNLEALRKRLSEHGQEHLLRFWDVLSETEQYRLSSELSTLDVGYVNRCYESCIGDLSRPNGNFDSRLEPLPESVVGSVVRSDVEMLERYENEGIWHCRFCVIAFENFFAGLCNYFLPCSHALHLAGSLFLLICQPLRSSEWSHNDFRHSQWKPFLFWELQYDVAAHAFCDSFLLIVHLKVHLLNFRSLFLAPLCALARKGDLSIQFLFYLTDNWLADTTFLAKQPVGVTPPPHVTYAHWCTVTAMLLHLFT